MVKVSSNHNNRVGKRGENKVNGGTKVSEKVRDGVYREGGGDKGSRRRGIG